MAKFYRPKLNSWLMTLGLVSIGLHGLVLALPMPSLVDPPPEIEELPEPEVIQVVTLPKLATTPESTEPPIPEPPLEEVPPPIEEPVEEVVLTDPEILDEVEPDPVDYEPDPVGDEPEPMGDDTGGDGDDGGQTTEPTLDERIATRDSYSNFDSTRVGNTVASTRLGEIFQQTGSFPLPMRALEGTLSAIVVPLQDCLDEQPGDSVSVMVEIDPDGALLEDPQLLNSTGYEVLDEKALEIAREANYAPHHTLGETKGYTFTITVDYEACNVASLRLTNTQAAS